MGIAIFRNNLTASLFRPSFTSQITASCIGGGGKGGDGNTSGDGQDGDTGGGGGGGAFASKVISVTSGSKYAMIVGSPGGDSWFSASNAVLAKAGSNGSIASCGPSFCTSGNPGLGGSVASSIGDIKYPGGSGSAGGGGGAGTLGNGGNASGTTPGTGSSLYGGTGGAGVSFGQQASGVIGSRAGGGGGCGGAYYDNVDSTYYSTNGALGAPGIVVLIYSESYSREEFISTSTWTCPQGVAFVTASCWGGGGNGGSPDISGDGLDWVSGGSGGGGAFAKKIVSVTPGTTYTVTVGGASQDSWFISNTTVLAKAGGNGEDGSCNATFCNSAADGSGGSAAASIGDVKYSGGNGGTNSGGGGGAAGSFGAGSSASGGPGQGSSEYGGNGGGFSGYDGLSGSYFGGGGAGGQIDDVNSGSPGVGSQGFVVLEYAAQVEVAFSGAFFFIF